MNTLVVSTAAYADAWEPFAALWRRFCGTRPLVLVSDVTDGTSRAAAAVLAAWGVRVIALPADVGWCAALAHGVRCLPADEAVLVLQEDFLLTEPPDSDALDALDALLAAEPDIGAVRLYPCPGPVNESSVADLAGHALGIVWPGEAYRVSCQATAWRPTALLELLDELVPLRLRTPADFELAGSQRLPGRWRVLGVLRSDPCWPLQYLCSAITSGQWEPAARKMLADAGIAVRGDRPTRVV